MTAPAMATGVPKPDVPSMMAPKEKAMRSTWSRRSKEMWTMDSFTISNLPGDDGHRVEEHGRQDDPDDAQEPESVPGQGRHGRHLTGIPKTRQDTTNAAITPKKAAYGAAMPRCDPVLVTVGRRAR